MQDMKDWPRVSPSVDIRKALESIEWCTTSDWYVKLGYVTTADSAQPFGCWECWRVCAGGTAFSLWPREPVDWPGQTESGKEREATLRALEEWFSYKPDWAEAFDDSFKYHIHVTESLFRDVFLHCQRAFPWLQSSQWSSARDDWLRTRGLGLGPNMWQAEEWMGYSPGNKKATLPGKQRTRSRINCRFWKWTFWHALDTSVLSQNQKKELDTSKLLNICKILEQLFYLEQLLDSNCLGTRGSTTNQAVFLEGTPHFTPPRPSTYRCSPKVLGYSGLESCLLFHANTALAGFVLLVVSSLLE